MGRCCSKPTQGESSVLPPQQPSPEPARARITVLRRSVPRRSWKSSGPKVVAALPALLIAAAPFISPPMGLAKGSPLAAALEWQDPGLHALRESLEVLETRLGPWGAFEYSARLRPLLRYRDYPGDGVVGEISARVGVSGRLNFTDPPATRVRTLKRREQLRRKIFLLRTRGVRDVLLAHAGLLVATEVEMRERRRLRPSQDGADPAPADRTLEQRQAALDHRRAAQALEVARAEAAAFGIVPPAPYRPLRFMLTKVPSHRQDDGSSQGALAENWPGHARRMLELELAEAEAELREEQSRVLDDLRIGAAYRSRGVEVEVEGGIVNGGPGAAFRVDFPGGRERWELTIHAELVLDDSAAVLAELEETVRLARAELSLFASRHAGAVADAHASAVLAEETVGLAEEQVIASEIAGNERKASSARLRLYRAWVDYLRKVQELLELTDGSWQVRPD